MPKLIQPNLNARHLTKELRALSTGTGSSDVLDLAHFPHGTLQVYGGAGGDAPANLAGTVQVSNLPDGKWVDWASFADANLTAVAGPASGGAGGFVLLPVGPRYVRINVTSLDSGLVGAIAHIPAQS